MTWTPLNSRLDRLPLILAGPILRRTEPDSVTVWVALKQPREVTLKVYSTTGNGAIVDRLILTGSRSTVQLGKYLHVVAVTAKSSDRQLQPSQIYAYDLDFTGGNLPQALNSDTFSPSITVSYFDHQLPTFSLATDDLNHLRIAHGSCRKIHGGGRDALLMLDELIEQYATLANSRPHQLFLTGDQIYGDDVANPLLWVLTEAGDALLGWEENLPTGDRAKKPSQLHPGDRSDIARDDGGFTGMLVNKPEKAKSHLFSLGEFYAMYLFAWSPILWSKDFPPGKTVQKSPESAKIWDKEVAIIQSFASELWQVQRLLANVPTYMVFDDHDISDDWYLNREWCNRVLGKPLGRRTVQNGLLAYAVFQAWGNTPEQFTGGNSGEKLLKAAQNWTVSAGTNESAWEEISKYLGLPALEVETGLPKLKLDENVLILDRNYLDGTRVIDWHYTVRSFKHEVIVLDTRTWRGYPQDNAIAPPMLLCPTAFKQQIRQPLELTDELKQKGESNIEITLVIVPTNLVSLSIIDLIQRRDIEQGKVFNSDAGDSWNFHAAAFTKLLAELFRRRDRIIILSGDIHYSCAVRLSYWFRRHFEDAPVNSNTPQQPRVLAQLTSSAIKNSEWKTYFIHTKAKSIALEQPQSWAGWNEKPELIEIQMIQEIVRAIEVKVPDESPILRLIEGTRGNGKIAWEIALKNRKSLPDWQYHIDWIEREKAKKVFAASPIRRNLEYGVSFFWRNRWIQEGEEVVGHSNFALVSFQWPQNNENAKAVIQDVFWRSPWEPNSTVYTRYFVPLRLDEQPPLLKVILS